MKKMTIPFDVKQAMDTGFFNCGTSQCGKTNLAKHQATMLMQSGVTVYVLDTSQAWNKVKSMAHIIVLRSRNKFTWNNSTIFDLSYIQTHDRVAFVDQFCKNLMDSHKQGTTKQLEFVIFEEAQTYMPNGCFRLSTRKKNIYANAVDLVTVGANFNVRFGLITQFPAMVDKAPVKITQQRYFGRTWEKNDVTYIKAFVGKDWVEQLRGLSRGEFIMQNGDRIERIQTPPYGAPNIMHGQTWANFEIEQKIG